MDYTYRIKVSNTTDKPQHEAPRDCKHILTICWTPFCIHSQEVLISPHTNASHSWMHPAYGDTRGGLQAPCFLWEQFLYLHLPPPLPMCLHCPTWSTDQHAGERSPCCTLCSQLPRCRAGRGSILAHGVAVPVRQLLAISNPVWQLLVSTQAEIFVLFLIIPFKLTFTILWPLLLFNPAGSRIK